MTRGPARCSLTAFVVSATLLAGGCVPQLMPDAPPPARSFDFGPLPEDAEPLPFPVRIGGVSTPSWLDGPEIRYRRLDEQPGAIRAYAQHQWVATPAEMLQLRLRHALAPPAPNNGGGPEPWLLYLEVLSFEQVFVSDHEAFLTVRARATLEGRAEAFERAFALQRPTSPDVQGATGGLASAADDLVLAIGAWLRDVSASR
jgi:hypothetical protein